VSQLRTSPPPPNAKELDVWMLETAAQLRELRAALIKALNEHTTVPAEKLDDIPERMVLVATELATNAIRHGLPPTTVRLLCTKDEFLLDVADHDLTSFPELAETRPINAGGRGLRLAQAFALEVGWYATEHSKHIWAAFPIEVESPT
jgi:serine/threonine-protein kinase RsbW